MLYEVITHHLEFAKSMLPMKELAINACHNIFTLNQEPRITSYNVCYTKLLRIEGGEKLLPSGSVFPHFFSTLNLCFLPAIFPADKSVESIITETHQVIEKTLEQIRAKKT